MEVVTTKKIIFTKEFLKTQYLKTSYNVSLL